jgi:hypothetical protein
MKLSKKTKRANSKTQSSKRGRNIHKPMPKSEARRQQLDRAHKEIARLNEEIRAKNRELAYRQVDLHAAESWRAETMQILKATVCAVGGTVTIQQTDYDDNRRLVMTADEQTDAITLELLDAPSNCSAIPDSSTQAEGATDPDLAASSEQTGASDQNDADLVASAASSDDTAPEPDYAPADYADPCRNAAEDQDTTAWREELYSNRPADYDRCTSAAADGEALR